MFSKKNNNGKKVCKIREKEKKKLVKK